MKGKVYHSNVQSRKDPITGVEVLRITDNKGMYDRPYFTTNQFSGDGKYTLFASDFTGTSKIKDSGAPAVGRVGLGELFTLELETGKATQVTQGEAIKMGHGCHALMAPSGKKAYYYSNEELKVVDLETLESRPLMHIPFSCTVHSLSITRDERYIAFTVVEAPEYLSSQFALNNPVGNPVARDSFFAGLRSFVVRYDTMLDKMHIVCGGLKQMTHVSLKPDDGDFLLYCHEGPWELVQRMWVARVSTDEQTPLIIQQKHLEKVGHEFFTPSCRVGAQYSYRYRADMPFFMHADIYVDIDGKNEERFYYPHSRPGHVSMNNDDSLAVGDTAELYAGMRDSSKMISLIRYNRETHKVEQSILCRHDSSGRKSAHVHPVFTPDGSHIVFTSDIEGAINIYMVPADASKAVTSF
ncbi:MAG: oligogalacturonate lyase family protein [Christensenellales bacterium]